MANSHPFIANEFPILSTRISIRFANCIPPRKFDRLLCKPVGTGTLFLNFLLTVWVPVSKPQHNLYPIQYSGPWGLRPFPPVRLPWIAPNLNFSFFKSTVNVLSGKTRNTTFLTSMLPMLIFSPIPGFTFVPTL